MDQIVSASAEIAQGRLQGVARDGVLRFNGIPYAKPPVGALRWRPAEPPEPWAGVRDASRFGNIAPQVPSASGAVLGATPGTRDEDCLYLNVQTPACDGAKRAVMVWIHGGGFNTGAGSVGTYNGKFLVPRGDVVLVTINYRLGAFGFLNLADASGGTLPGTGTEGLGDQLAALHWVKENIAAFGGDPHNVTIFGESAGGMSVGCLLAMPEAHGLFHKAIAQSGATHIGADRDSSCKIARLMLEGLAGGDPLTMDWQAILDVQRKILDQPRETGTGMPFMPTIDGELLPEKPIDAIRKGAARGIPVMTGTTRDEWNLFTIAAANLKTLDPAGLHKLVVRAAGEAHADRILAAYPDGTPFARWNAIMTDRAFFVPATRLLDAQGPHAPAYAYRFDWPSPALGGALGSCHALELGFTFGTFRLKGAAPFFGEGPQAEALSDAMMESWIAFAKTGDPSNGTAGTWPGYGAARTTMMFGDGDPHMTRAPNEARRLAWEPVGDDCVGP
jgi:para-nitrobenzyl esterase